jgi:hypothetical protein
MKLIQIPGNVLINPEHISAIQAAPKYEGLIIYTIIMYNDRSFNISIHQYWNQNFPFAPLFAAYPDLANRLNGDAR